MMDLKDSRKHRKEESKYRLMTAKQNGKIYQFSGSYKNVTGRIDKKSPKLNLYRKSILISCSQFQQICHRIVLKACTRSDSQQFHSSF